MGGHTIFFKKVNMLIFLKKRKKKNTSFYRCGNERSRTCTGGRYGCMQVMRRITAAPPVP